MTTDGLDMCYFLATRPTRPWETGLFLALLKLGLHMTYDLYYQMQLVGIGGNCPTPIIGKLLDLPVGNQSYQSGQFCQDCQNIHSYRMN